MMLVKRLESRNALGSIAEGSIPLAIAEIKNLKNPDVFHLWTHGAITHLLKICVLPRGSVLSSASRRSVCRRPGRRGIRHGR